MVPVRRAARSCGATRPRPPTQGIVPLPSPAGSGVEASLLPADLGDHLRQHAELVHAELGRPRAFGARNVHVV